VSCPLPRRALPQYAAKKADAPLNEDECMRAAFEAAYEQTRWELGVWSWCVRGSGALVCVCVCVWALARTQ